MAAFLVWVGPDFFVHRIVVVLLHEFVIEMFVQEYLNRVSGRLILASCAVAEQGGVRNYVTHQHENQESWHNCVADALCTRVSASKLNATLGTMTDFICQTSLLVVSAVFYQKPRRRGSSQVATRLLQRRHPAVSTTMLSRRHLIGEKRSCKTSAPYRVLQMWNLQ